MKLFKLDDERKKAIINSALMEFTLKGYDGASTNEIAKNAEISKALMFHYVESKEELFLYVNEYSVKLFSHEFIEKMNFRERDLLKRLQQSFYLQVNILKDYPWLLDFIKLNKKTKSEKINKKLAKTISEPSLSCYDNMFSHVDSLQFRNKIPVENAKQLIYFGTIGFTEKIISEIRTIGTDSLDYVALLSKIDAYFYDLRATFYEEQQ